MYGRGSQPYSNGGGGGGGGGRRGSNAASSSRNRGAAQHHHQQQAAAEETDEFGRVKRRADDDRQEQQQPRRSNDDRPSTSSSTRRRRDDDPRAAGSSSNNDNRRAAADRRSTNNYDASAYHRDAAAAAAWAHPAAAYPPGAQDYYGVDPYAAAAYGVPTGPSGYYAQEAAAAAAQWGMPYAAGYYGAPPPTGPRDPYGASRSRPRDRDRDRVAATDTAGSSSSSSRNSSQRVRDERTTASSSRKRTLSPSQSASRDESTAGSGREDRRAREQEREREAERDKDRAREEQRRRASPPLRAPTSPRRKPVAAATTTTSSPAITAPDPDARTKARRAASRSATAKDVWVDSLNYTDMEEDSSDAAQAKARNAGSPMAAAARKASPSAPSAWSPSQRQPPTGPRAERAAQPASPPKSAPTGPASSRPVTAASRQSGGGRASQSPELDRRANGGRKRSRTPANQPHAGADSPTTQPGRRKASVSPETSKRVKWTRGGDAQAGDERSTTLAQPPPPPAAPRQILEVASTDPSVPAVMTTLASSPIRDPHTAADDDDDDDDESSDESAPPTTSSSPPRAPPQELYTRIAQVGEGTYGQVFKARSHPSNHLVALKKIRMESEKDGFPITAMREIKLLQMLRHENVVRLHEMMTTLSGGKVGAVYMVFEYMEHDLNGILHHPSIQFTEANRKSLASQLLQGLAYLHSKSVLHRDLKGSNILLNALGQLKLADFGLARLYAKRRTDADYTNRVVTLWYRPPELLLGATRYGTEVDTWGAGCIFLELWTKKAVFQGQDEINQVQSVVDVLGPMGGEGRWEGVGELPWWELIRPTPPALEPEDIAAAQESGRDPYSTRFRRLYTPLIPASALDVAEALLAYDPKKRASAAEALEMPYFTEEKPRARMPREALGRLKGEWHELESRRARGRGGGAGARGAEKVGAGEREREKKEEAEAMKENAKESTKAE